jgi:hypothetical protein
VATLYCVYETKNSYYTDIVHVFTDHDIARKWVSQHSTSSQTYSVSEVPFDDIKAIEETKTGTDYNVTYDFETKKYHVRVANTGFFSGPIPLNSRFREEPQRWDSRDLWTMIVREVNPTRAFMEAEPFFDKLIKAREIETRFAELKKLGVNITQFETVETSNET